MEDGNKVPAVTGVIAGKDIDETKKPINKWDWFKLSRDWLNTADTRIKEQSDSIQSAVKWLFGLTSSAAILTVLVKEPQFNQYSLILMAVAMVSLMGAYALSTLAITTISREMPTPEDAEQLRETFNKSVRTSKCYLTTASCLLVAGMTLYPLAVVLAYRREEPTASAKFTVRAITIGKDSLKNITALDISGSVPKISMIQFRLDAGQNISVAKPMGHFSHALNHTAFDYTIPMSKSIKVSQVKYFLTLYYKDEKDSLANKSVEVIIP